ncbi:MAG TPA: hypothetical protein VNH84_10345 [Candidatus Saccharimonadales bacterium]|nr:hypothetical protein [Candidatus Saccharimonadales bacterium]
MTCLKFARAVSLALVCGSLHAPARAATFVVTNTADSGPGSLRQSLLAAAAVADGVENRIEFQLSNPPFRIQPLSQLPDLQGPIVIDGFTQPGFTGRPLIELRGDRAGAADGLRLSGGYCRVQGLVINRFQHAGIRFLGGTNTIRGNFIGTDLNGKTSLGNGEAGIDLFLGEGGNLIGGPNSADRNVISGNRWGLYILAPDNTVQGNLIGVDVDGIAALGNVAGITLVRAQRNLIGGTDPGEGNIVSGNAGNGIELLGGFIDGATDNIIAGNVIGANAAGTAALRNGLHGVVLGANADANVLGGLSPGARNVISGNAGQGVLVTNALSGNQFLGNAIGADVSGTNALPNGGHGIDVWASGQTIGGPGDHDGNTIAFNTLAGVAIESGTNNLISGNRLFSNGRLGIELDGDNVTPNDDGDADEGPNHLQNYPELTASRISGTNIVVEGTLRSRPSTSYAIEFFASSVCSPSGSGEGFELLGRTNLTTLAGGTVDFVVNLRDGVPIGWMITATATDPAGNTSEFSTCLPLAGEPRVVPVFQLSPANQSAVAGGSVTFSALITGDPPPFEFELRRTAGAIRTNLVSARQTFFTLSGLSASDGGIYRILVRNAATMGLGVSSRPFTLTVLPDADGDGLPDSWELAYGMATNNAADAVLDADGDGATNLEEYRADTNPTNRVSGLKLSATRSSTGGQPLTLLSFEAISNKTYSVQYRDRLTEGAWSNTLDWVARTNTVTVTITNPLPPGIGERFFRLVTPAQP